MCLYVSLFLYGVTGSLCKCVHSVYLSDVIVCMSCCLKQCIDGEGVQFVFWVVIGVL